MSVRPPGYATPVSSDVTTRGPVWVDGVLQLEPLEEELCSLAAHLNAGIARWLEAVREFEREGGDWGAGELRSYAHWLAWRCGLSLAEARESVRVARRLPELPLIEAAFRRGELSYAKVRSLTRVAEPRDEQGLLELAGALTTGQLERIVQAYRRVTREQAADSQDRSFLSYCWEEDGSLLLRARLPAEEGAVVLRALELARERLRRKRRAEAAAQVQARQADEERDPQRPAPERAASASPALQPDDPLLLLARPTNVDALVAVAESALAGEAKERSGADRCQIVVHVDADTLSDDEEGESGRCHVQDGPAIASQTARRLACDSSLVRMVERDGQPLSIGRKTRKIPPALRRALRARDRYCQFPGCTNTVSLDAHHLRHWAKGGETSLDNLILLCGPHHRLVHEGDPYNKGAYRAERKPDGRIQFYHPRGAPIPYVPPLPRGHPRGIAEQNHRQGLRIDARTTKNGIGERMEFAYVADVFSRIVSQRE